jgi:hypothetical protein
MYTGHERVTGSEEQWIYWNYAERHGRACGRISLWRIDCHGMMQMAAIHDRSIDLFINYLRRKIVVAA